MKKNISERGQAIVLLTFALVALMGFAALAIDGGIVYSDRRHAQNAADAAALAGAYAKVRGENWLGAAQGRANDNGFDNDGTTNTVTVNNPPQGDGPYAGNIEYIQVIVDSQVETSLIHFVYTGDVVNTVEAVARAKPSTEMFFGHAMVALSQTGRAVYELNGGPGTEVTGGGIFVNSDNDPCAFEVNGGSGSFSVPSITVVGEACPETTGGTTATSATQLPPPDYKWLDEAIGCTNATYYNASVDRSGSTISPHVSPLRFSSDFPPNGVDTLGPGIYCLDGDFKITSTNDDLYGTEVTFVMSAGGITLNGGEIELSAPSTGPTTGLLFYQPISNNHINNSASISGNATLLLTGTILTPGVKVAISGSPNTHINGQVIGDEISLSGDAGSTVHYDDDQNINDPPQIELTQ